MRSEDILPKYCKIYFAFVSQPDKKISQKNVPLYLL